MPIAICIGLKEDGTRGVLRGVGGNGERFGEVREVEDRARQEEFLQGVEGLLTSRSPIPAIVFLGKVKEGAGDSRVVGYKLTVEISKAQEGLYVLDFGGGQSSGNAIELDWVHGKLTRFYDHSEVFNFWDVELAFLEL